MAVLDLHYVNELIQVRQAQHGGGPGAPPIQAGHRVGTSINRSCVVMLSALLQSYVEEVFQEAARRRFPALAADPDAFERYWNQMKNWGNPSDVNIRHLFLKLGVPNVFQGLSWQRTTTAAITAKLDLMNRVRNQIAHGTRQLTNNQQPYSLSLAEVVAFRNMVQSFAARFEGHVEILIP